MASADEPEWVLEQAAKGGASPLPSSASSSPILDHSADEAEEKASLTAETGKPTQKLGKDKSRGAPATSLPLLLAPKVQHDALLMEAVDPDLDLSGDFGCIGRLHLAEARERSSGRLEPGAVTLDLKGKVYQGDFVPTNSTLCLVTIDGNKARVDAVFNEFVQLSGPCSTIFDMEAVQHGELGSTFFADDDEGDEYMASDAEELGPLKEKRGGAKSARATPSKAGGRAKKLTSAGAKRKAPAAKKPQPKPKAGATVRANAL